MKLELYCNVCGTHLEVDEVNPVQLEHMMDIWKRDHKHSPAAREAWYRHEAAGILPDDEEA